MLFQQMLPLQLEAASLNTCNCILSELHHFQPCIVQINIGIPQNYVMYLFTCWLSVFEPLGCFSSFPVSTGFISEMLKFLYQAIAS